ncbi:LrgB family protein [Pseudomonas sp.]|uniref:LrgB family protein n=1 Tax=Pseudomonas sp. TaxID=306 RepID=UPI003D0F544F
MNLDWYGAWQAVTHHPLFGVGVTLGAYQLSIAAYEKTRWVFLQPVLLSMVIVISVLLLCGLGFEEYKTSAEALTLFLGPATVALAVPLFLNLRRIRQLFWPIVLTLLVAGTVATLLGVAFAWWFGAEDFMLLSMAPKSVTSPIAMLVASQIGGIAALAAVFVMITGVVGAILGPSLLRLCGIRHHAAMGMALGMTAHAVGTARAMQESEECGAFAALSMSLMGMVTAVLLPLAFVLLNRGI